MDRAIVYDGQIPQTVDILQSNKLNMIGLGFALQALLGTGVCVNGLACTQTSPSASTSVTVAPGAIYQTDTVDATAYGDLSTDANTIVKQGLLYNALTLTPAFTGTSGQSQVFLVEAKFADADGGSTVLPYYNSANPSSPLWGSNLAASQLLGTPQNTIRTSVCTVQLKAGTPATTGSQTTPSPDAGFIGLFTITLAFGFSTITNANIAQVATAPFFPNLPAVPSSLQTETWTFATDTGAVNALVASIVPAPAALVSGLTVQIKVSVTNTGASTLNLNGLGVKNIKRGTTLAALSAGDLTSGQIATFSYDGTQWQLVNYPNTFSTTQTNTFNSLPVAYAVDTGTTNNLVVSANCNTPSGLGINVPPGPITFLFAGLTLLVKVANSNTGASTIAVNNIAPANIMTDSDGLNLPWFAMVAGEIIVLVYDGTNFRKMPRKNKYFAFDETFRPPPDFDPDHDKDPNHIFWPPFRFDNKFPFWPFWDSHRNFFEAFVGPFPPLPVQPAVPSNPSLLPISVGDQVNITFTNVTSVPLKIATAPGIYEVEINITSSNTECCDHWHMPNDVLGFIPNNGVPPFQTHPHRSHDDFNGNFLSDIDTVVVEPDVAFGRFPAFEQHREESRFGQPPFFLKMICVTYPFMKHIRTHGGCYGGSFHHHSKWIDVTIPWTSLGTFVVAQKFGHRRCPQGIDLATLTGLAVVRRLA